MYFFKRVFCMNVAIVGIFLLLGIFQTGCSREKSHENILIAHDFTQQSDPKIYDILPLLYFDAYTQQYLGSGWGNPETDGNGNSYIWSVGQSSHVRFYVTELRDLMVTMHCFPFKVEGQQQQIAIGVNAHDVTTIPLDRDDGIYTFTISKTCLTLGENLMMFTYAYTRTPQSLNINNDPRELGVRFLRLDFDPTSHEDRPVVQESLNHLAQISRMKIGEEMQLGLLQRPQSAMVFDKCYIPPSAALKFAIGIHPRAQASDAAVTFSVVVNEFRLSSSQTTHAEEMFVETLHLQTPSDRVWKEYAIDLSAYAGKVVTLAFNVESRADPQTIFAMWGTPCIVAKEPSQQYNIILITLDALRTDHVGSYGYSKQTTPNIDALARESVKFTQCYSVAPWTLPSFASYYTALYPQTVDAHASLAPHFVTAPSFLKPYGYFTQLMTDHPFFETKFGLSRAFDGQSPSRENTFNIDNIQRFLKHVSQEKFFLHLHLLPPHEPYIAAAPYDEIFLNFDAPILNDMLKLRYGHNDMFRWHDLRDNPEKVRYLIDLYDANIALADEFLGKIIHQIKHLGLYDKTLIIVSSDHGEGFFAHEYYWGHGNSLYNELLSVPLLIRFPKALKIPPSEITSPVLTIDILPTILAVNGIPVPEYFQGQSLWDDENHRLRTIEREYSYFAEQHADTIGSKTQLDLEGVRWKNYKYIYSGVQKTEELYDLATDPAEQRNLIDEYPEIVEQLRTALSSFKLNTKIISPAQDASQVDDHTLQRLRELGYAK